MKGEQILDFGIKKTFGMSRIKQIHLVQIKFGFKLRSQTDVWLQTENCNEVRRLLSVKCTEHKMEGLS